MAHTFDISEETGKYGHRFYILTANEYPFIRCQVVPTAPDQYDTVMAALHERGEYIVTAAGRTDFCIIQASGTKDGIKVHITQHNYKEVDRAICECMQDAADFWAEKWHGQE